VYVRVRLRLHLRFLFAARRIKTGSALDSLAMHFLLVLVSAMAAVESVAMIAHGRSEPLFIGGNGL
jgi:hypothetical protein